MDVGVDERSQHKGLGPRASLSPRRGHDKVAGVGRTRTPDAVEEQIEDRRNNQNKTKVNSFRWNSIDPRYQNCRARFTVMTKCKQFKELQVYQKEDTAKNVKEKGGSRGRRFSRRGLGEQPSRRRCDG